MAYVICKHPNVRLDLMVAEAYWPQVASMMERTGCGYLEEKHVQPEGCDEKYVVLRDLQGHSPIGGSNLAELLGLFYGLEWQELTNPGNQPRKFYILMSPRRKEKKDVQENRSETGAGRNGRNTGKSAGDLRFGPGSGAAGSGSRSGILSHHDIRQLQIEQDQRDDDCE